MNQKEQPVKRKRIWPWITLAVVVILVGGVRLAMRSDLVMDRIRTEAELRVSELLDAELHIGRMRGDLWSGITLEDIRLYEAPGNETVSIDTLSVSWSVIDLIFRRPLEIKKAHVLGLRADIKQNEEGMWNVLELIPETEMTEEEKDQSPFQFVLKDVRVTAPLISVDAAALMPDEPFSIQDMEILVRLGQDEGGFFVDLHTFDLSVHESRLDAPVQLESEASWDGQRITLDKLVVAGAHSLFDLTGNFDTVTKAGDLEALLEPLAWREAAAYLEEYPLRQDVTVSLHAAGSRQDFRAGVTINAPGLEDLSIDSRWSFMQETVLNGLEITSGRVDAGLLTGADTLLAQFEALTFSLDGAIPLNEWDRVAANGMLAITELQYEEHRLDELTMDLSAQNGIVRTETILRKGGESIRLDVAAERLWEPDFKWAATYELTEQNPAFWIDLEALEGSITSHGTLTGSGLEPGISPWIAEIEVGHFRLGNYPEASLVLNGEFTADSLHAVADIRLADGEIDLEAGMLWRLEKPEYKLDMHLSNLNIGTMPGLEDVVTSINAAIHVTGAGFDPETMAWDASLLLEDTHINRQEFDAVELNLALRDGIVQIDDALLSSVPARGHLSLRQNILDLKDPRNRLDFDLELLDIQGFGSLAGTDTLQARGKLTGEIHPNEEGELVFIAGLDLEDVQYDTIRVQQLEGSASVVLADEMSYQADLAFGNPSAGPHTIQDITINTNGRLTDSGVRGVYELTFNIENTSGMRTRAEYETGDTIRVRTLEMELTDPAGVYLLREPFDVVLADGYVFIDTIYLESDRESVFSAYLHKTPDTPWTGYVDARETDLGQVQYVFLEAPYFEAMFTGRIDFSIDEDLLDLKGYAEFSQFRKDDLELDSLHLGLNIAERRFVIDASVWHFESELLRAEFDLPFELRDPESLGDDFFEESVNGYLRVHPIDTGLFDEFLTNLGLEGMSGEFSLETTLGGTAGAPDMIGEMRLSEGTFSGVSVDTLLLSWDYDHNRNDVFLTSRVHSLGQKAADINSRLPLYIDFQHLEVKGPASDDPLQMSITTSDFNLAAFNDFLNPDQIRNLQGKLNARVEFGGTISDPELDGNLVLAGGQLQLIQTNTTLRNIQLEAGFEPGKISLNRLSVQSVGTISGEGSIAIDGFTPDALDLRFNANNFRVFNTRDIEIYAGLNLQLEGTLESPMLKGDVRWERGTLFLDDFGDRDVEEVVLEEEETQTPEGPDFYDRMEMELRFSVDRNAYVRNRRDPEVNLALRGELDLLKEPFGDLQLFGDMSIPSGQVTTFNRRFQLEHGNVLFSGDPSDPQLDIRTLYQPRQQYEEIFIYYVITGTVSDPEFTYESEPVMELQDIISYTLFGRPFHALAGWEQSVSGRSDGSMATSMAVDILLDRIETLASDRLGIDVIEIENTRKGGGSGTSIKAGKFISDRLFVAFLQELGGTEAGRQVVIEYLISRNLELILTASDDYRSGVDMLWRYDY